MGAAGLPEEVQVQLSCALTGAVSRDFLRLKL